MIFSCLFPSLWVIPSKQENKKFQNHYKSSIAFGVCLPAFLTLHKTFNRSNETPCRSFCLFLEIHANTKSVWPWSHPSPTSWRKWASNDLCNPTQAWLQ